MATIDQFYNNDCGKIDPSCVNAYLSISLDPLDSSKLILDSSWGKESLDLTPAVKKAETVTHLSLYPDDNPTDLMFCNEDGEAEHITGDALSHIISMTKLKDVDQDDSVSDGDVYVYNGETGKFEPFDLIQNLNEINQSITELGAQITQIQNAIDAINQVIAKPDNIPSSARIAWGNINLISDPTDTNNKGKGLFTHSTLEDLYADEYFA